MAFSAFTSWLRHHSNEMVDRCAEVLRRRRLQRARAQLPLHAREQADVRRARYLARNARLQREREARAARRETLADPQGLPAAPSLGKADVLAAIARSRASREARLKARRDRDNG